MIATHACVYARMCVCVCVCVCHNFFLGAGHSCSSTDVALVQQSKIDIVALSPRLSAEKLPSLVPDSLAECVQTLSSRIIVSLFFLVEQRMVSFNDVFPWKWDEQSMQQ